MRTPRYFDHVGRLNSKHVLESSLMWMVGGLRGYLGFAEQGKACCNANMTNAALAKLSFSGWSSPYFTTIFANWPPLTPDGKQIGNRRRSPPRAVQLCSICAPSTTPAMKKRHASAPRAVEGATPEDASDCATCLQSSTSLLASGPKRVAG